MSLSKYPAIAPKPEATYLYSRGGAVTVDYQPRMEGVHYYLHQEIEYLRFRLVSADQESSILRSTIAQMVDERTRNLSRIRMLEEEIKVLQDQINQGKQYEVVFQLRVEWPTEE